MNATNIITLFFTQKSQSSVIKKILLSLGFACLTGLVAQLRIHLPWTPIPITGQTCAVLLSGIILGSWWGGISQALYVLLGIVGIPWFSNGEAGLNCLIGPTGGYLIGFVLNAFFIGFITDIYPKAKNFSLLLPIMFMANFFFIHSIGLMQFSLWLSLIQHTPTTLWQLCVMGFFPFIIGDIIKIIIAASVASCILKKKNPN